MPHRLPAHLVALADAQSDVVARSQLTAVGIHRWSVQHHVDAGRWRREGPRVVRLTTGTPTRLQLRWIAVLHAGEFAALVAWSALEHHGYAGRLPDAVHVVVPRGAPPVPPLPGLVVHESRRLRPRDVAVRDGLPIVSPARAAIDAASWTTTVRAGAVVLCVAVQAGLTTPAAMRRELDTAGRIRHARALRLVIDDLAGGSRALGEIDLVRECRRRGLPAPTRQVVRLDSRGRRRYVDAVIRGRDGRVVQIEVDGAAHLDARGWADELYRHNEIALTGGLLLRVPTLALRFDPEPFFDQLRRALAAPTPARHAAS